MTPVVFMAGTSLEVSVTIAELGLVILFLGFLSWLALRLKISSVPLFLAAGLSLGKGGLFPLNVSEQFLSVGAEIGAILLLLVLGFEYSARELVDSMKKRWVVGLIDVLVNTLPAAALALILGFGPLGAFAFAGIMFVSSSGIASQLIRETGWSRSNVAKRTTSVLVFEDIMLAPYLPLLVALSLGVGAATGFISVGVALLVTVAVFLFGLGREIPGLRSLVHSGPGVLLLLVFGLALSAAGLASAVGFSGAIAAFLVGLLFTGEVAESLRNRFAPLREIFSALFFLFFGLSISFQDVLQFLPIAILFSVLGIAGKFYVGWWIGRDMSDPMSWKRIAAFLSSRGEFSMIIASTVVAQVSFQGIKEITLGVVVLTTVFSTLAIRAFRSRLEH
ncbi:MAG: cation:proton antiporter [Microbacteriaceae bacterium]|nr:cation:proton antiporter [Microbacteriaceae bacterium]